MAAMFVLGMCVGALLATVILMWLFTKDVKW